MHGEARAASSSSSNSITSPTAAAWSKRGVFASPTTATAAAAEAAAAASASPAPPECDARPGRRSGAGPPPPAPSCRGCYSLSGRRRVGCYSCGQRRVGCYSRVPPAAVAQAQHQGPGPRCSQALVRPQPQLPPSAAAGLGRPLPGTRGRAWGLTRRAIQCTWLADCSNRQPLY